MLVGVVDLLWLQWYFVKFLANLRIFQWKVQKLEQLSDQNHSQHVTQCSYHKWYRKLRFKSFKWYIQFNTILHVIRMAFVCALISLICQYSLISLHMSIVCHSYVTCMCSYVIRMSLVCTSMSTVCYKSVVLP